MVEPKKIIVLREIDYSERMNPRKLSFFFTILLAFQVQYALSTAQFPDILIFKGDTLALFSNPLEPYFETQSDTSKTLRTQVEQVEVAYTLWGCSCPNWIRVSDLHQQENESTLFIDYHFYLEPADDAPAIPDDFDPFQHKLILDGQFYEEEGLPEGWFVGEEPLRLAQVFRYTRMKMMPLEKKRQ